MHIVKRLLAVVYVVACAVTSGTLVGLVLGPLPRIVHLLEYAPVRYAVAGCAAVSLLGALIVLIRTFATRRAPDSILPAGTDDIEVTLTALASIARAAAETEDVMVDRVLTRVRGRDRTRARITLETIAFTNSGLDELARRIQEHVLAAADEMLGARCVEVRVRFLPSKTTTYTKEVPREQG